MRKLTILLAVLFLFGVVGCMTVTEVVTEEQLEKNMEEAVTRQGTAAGMPNNSRTKTVKWGNTALPPVAPFFTICTLRDLVTGSP